MVFVIFRIFLWPCDGDWAWLLSLTWFWPCLHGSIDNRLMTVCYHSTLFLGLPVRVHSAVEECHGNKSKSKYLWGRLFACYRALLTTRYKYIVTLSCARWSLSVLLTYQSDWTYRFTAVWLQAQDLSRLNPEEIPVWHGVTCAWGSATRWGVTGIW